MTTVPHQSAGPSWGRAGGRPPGGLGQAGLQAVKLGEQCGRQGSAELCVPFLDRCQFGFPLRGVDAHCGFHLGGGHVQAFEIDGLAGRHEADGSLDGVGLAFKALDGVKTANADQKAGVDIVRRAIQVPARQIVQNAGEDGSLVVGNLLEKDHYNWGFNAATGEYQDLVSAGVIDPAKVVRTALQNAASVAGILITTEAAIVEAPKKDAGGAGGMPGGMGGMGGMDF